MSRRFVARIALAVSLVGLGLAACSVTVNPGDNSVDFTIAGMTFRISFGEQGVFDTTADGPPIERAFAVQLFESPPADSPPGASLVLEAESIQIIPAASNARTAALLQASKIEIYVSDTSSGNPFTDGVYVGTFDAGIFGSSVILEKKELPIPDSLMAACRAGFINLGVRVRAEFDGRIILEEMLLQFDEMDGGNGGTDDDQGGDGDSPDDGDGTDDGDGGDDVDDGDGIDDGDGGDGGDGDDPDGGGDQDPIDSRDPDGDGKFEAFACDALNAVVMEATDPVISGPYDENCYAEAVFTNTSSGDIIVLARLEWSESDFQEGWYAYGVHASSSATTFDHAFAGKNTTLGDGRDVRYIAEIAAIRADGEYFDGCGWIHKAIREDDTQESVSALNRRATDSLRPCD